jgi:transposase-like protein
MTRRSKKKNGIRATSGAEGASGAGSERSELEAPEARRGRPGRRTTEERSEAVLALLSGKASVDQLAMRFGVHPSTVERWQEQVLGGIEAALRTGNVSTPREQELEKKLGTLEKPFTNLAIKHELVERALAQRPSQPGKWPR